MRFELDEEEIRIANEWLKEHDKKCRIKYSGAIGGKITYKFTPTSLGEIKIIECVCGERKDVTFYDW